MIDCLISRNLLKLSDAENRIHRIIDDYKPETETKYEDKK